MISEPIIVNTDSQIAAVIHITIARNEMMKVFGPAIGELMKELATQGVEPVGAVFAHHHKMSPGIFDFDLGVKVTKAIVASGRIKPGELPALRVARTTYHGPYEGLPAAWAEFTKWIDAAGHKSAENLWELYSVGPQASADSANWQTELTRPLL
jgi:effector-binding domain-containing protein